MAMNLTDSGSNMHSEEQQNPEQVAKFNITFRLYASTMKRKAYAILRDEGWAEDAVQWTFMKLLQHLTFFLVIRKKYYHIFQIRTMKYAKRRWRIC